MQRVPTQWQFTAVILRQQQRMFGPRHKRMSIQTISSSVSTYIRLHTGKSGKHVGNNAETCEP